MKTNRFVAAVLLSAVVPVTMACFLLAAPRGPLKFEPASLPEAQLGTAYDAKIVIRGNVTPAGEFSVPADALPKGLSLEKVEGEDAARIAGTPEETGTFQFKVYVWCYGTNVSGQTGEKEYTLVVK